MLSFNGGVISIGPQVEFKDTTKSSDLSAVQVDEESSYMAVDTSFVGFQGEVGFYERACSLHLARLQCIYIAQIRFAIRSIYASHIDLFLV